MIRNNIKAGLFGYGCVGQGLFNVVKKSIGFTPEIKKICVKQKEKKRNLDEEYFTFFKQEILDNPDINVVIELTDDADAAFEITEEALKNGKAVVTANKKMVSENLGSIISLQANYGIPFLYEASCCASIPVIRNFEEYYDNDLLQSFNGIFNGTTNYILTDIFRYGKKYPEALDSAQKNGFAESNPELDIEGYDSKYKLCILLTHAFGLTVKPDEIFNLGIQRINDFDLQFANEKKGKIKLIARAQKLNGGGIAAFVMPELVYENEEMFSIDGVNNAIVTENYFSEKNIFVGKGAGAFPTAAAVISDLSALSYDYKYEYKKKLQNNNLFIDNNILIDVYVRFNGEVEVCTGEFEEIYGKYYSGKQCYITGKINFYNLINSKWINEESTNVILIKSELSWAGCSS